MRKRFGKFVLPCLAAGMLVLAVIHVVRAQQKLPKPPPPVEPARTPFGSTVAGAGIVEAVNENVSVGTALPGIVLEVYVPVEDVGRVVQKGDPLFRVDDRQLKAQLEYNRANLEAAQAQLAKLEAQPREEEKPPSAAKVAVAEANLALQRDLAERARRMAGTAAVAEEELRQKALNVEVARRQLTQARAEDDLLLKGAWQYDKEIARASVRLAAAQAKQTETDIDRALVRAPCDGVVLQVNVRPGEYVGTPPNQAAFVLGAVRQTVHVRVDIDEHDIPRFQKGVPAKASLRGAPETAYPLRFVRVEPYVIPKKSLTGDNTERVDTRVLQVIYELDVTGKPVYVGQQMDVFIDVGRPEAPAESYGGEGGP
jgi:multidrug resistance efflux pump